MNPWRSPHLHLLLLQQEQTATATHHQQQQPATATAQLQVQRLLLIAAVPGSSSLRRGMQVLLAAAAWEVLAAAGVHLVSTSVLPCSHLQPHP